MRSAFWPGVLLSCVCLLAVSARAETEAGEGGGVVMPNGDVWLADMDLPAAMPLSVPLCSETASLNCINANGSMNYATAKRWVAALNTAQYLGRDNWRLPITQSVTPGCESPGPNGENFGYGCNSSLGAIYNYIGLTSPQSVAPATTGSFGPFTNLQPNYYWTQTPGATGGFRTFSFASGWTGENLGVNPPGKNPNANFFFVLPMLDGDAGGRGTVYDPASGKSWLANGNIAASRQFGLAMCSGLGGATFNPCVNPNGSMTLTSAETFIGAMNAADYLGHHNWKLPTVSAPNVCKYADCATDPAGNPIESLFYNLLGLGAGDSVAAAATDSHGPFYDVQPYLYWSCQADGAVCSALPQCSPKSRPHPCQADYEWSYNFGEGFQGTDEESNDLFVTAFSADTPALSSAEVRQRRRTGP